MDSFKDSCSTLTNSLGVNSPRFSIIIPLYNKEKSIRSTIESVLNQTYNEFELIIVNDGSTDLSMKVAESFIDPRIKVINKANGGVSSARNLGIIESKNEFLVFLDADDLWLPWCLNEFYKLITGFPQADVFCTNYNMTERALKGSERRYYVQDYYYTSAFFLAKWSIPLIITGCISIRRCIFDKIGYFNENYTHGEDTEMWERLGKGFKIAKSEKVTTIYRTEAENRSSFVENGLRKESPLNEHWIHNGDFSISQKLFLGVQSFFLIRLILSSRKLTLLKSVQRIYYRYLLKGIFFFISVRIFKFFREPNYKGSKC